ncbi:TolB family protein [Lysobacter koreensis]|uniref:TolB family protein n=1 Tax=Lysobacter koreensis TaxID=266122 RepID=A0ABW2YPS0_9GAMM
MRSKLRLGTSRRQPRAAGVPHWLTPLAIAAGIASLAPIPAAAAEAPTRLVRVVDYESSVSRDGRLAFVSNRSGAFELYTTDADGKQPRQLTFDGGGKDNPSWSPDGTRIAYVAQVGDNADIHLIDAHGTRQRRLTTGPHRELHPFWSPDGTRIVFTRYVDSPPGAGVLSVHAMDADGGNETALTHGTSASYASFSPDGKHLLYWRLFGDNAEIVIADADGRDEKRLTRDPAFDGWPSWAPDGTRIAFARERGDAADIYTLDLATGTERLLSGGRGRKTAPKWTADGTAVLFDRTLDGETGIWRIDAGGGR